MVIVRPVAVTANNGRYSSNVSSIERSLVATGGGCWKPPMIQNWNKLWQKSHDFHKCTTFVAQIMHNFASADSKSHFFPIGRGIFLLHRNFSQVIVQPPPSPMIKSRLRYWLSECIALQRGTRAVADKAWTKWRQSAVAFITVRSVQGKKKENCKWENKKKTTKRRKRCLFHIFFWQEIIITFQFLISYRDQFLISYRLEKKLLR